MKVGDRMRGLFGFYFLTRIFGNPLVALLVIVFIYILIDRRFVGLLPDVFKPFRTAGSIRRLRQALEINPSDSNAHLELGMLLSEKGRWEQAVGHLERAAARLDNSQSLYGLGAAYFRVGRIEDGKAALEKALEMNPKVAYGEPYLYLAEYQLKNGGRIDDVPGLTEALAQFGSVEVLYHLGRLYEQAGETKEARVRYREALETHRANPAFLRRKQRRTALRAWFRAQSLKG